MREASVIRESVIVDETHTELILRRLALVCITITAGISIAAIIGWVLNWLFLARISPAYIPMAPGSALSFLILSFGLFVYARKPEHPQAMTFAKVGTFLVLLFCFIILIDFFTGTAVDIEKLLLSRPEKLGDFPAGRMSPISAANFLLSACALLFLLTSPQGWHRAKSAASCLAVIVVSAGLVMVLGYLYGTPLLYGGTIIPVALTTAIAFVFMGTGFIAAAGQHYFPVSSFAGSSLRARLMRTFIPVAIAIILINGLSDIVIYPSTNNHVLSESIVAILSLIMIPGVISRIAQTIGGDIDRANNQRKQAQEALTEQSRIMEAFYKYTITSIVFLDKHFNFIRVNEAYARACQRDASEFLGHNHFEFYPNEENLAIFKKVVETKVRYLAVAKPFSFPDHPELGTTFWDWTLTPLLDSAGEVEFLVFSLNDVTERVRAESITKESEEKFRNLVERSLAGVYIIQDGKFPYVNPKLAQIFGYTQNEIISSKSMSDLVAREDHALDVENILIQLQSDTQGIHYTFRGQRKDGALIDIEVYGTRIEYKGKPAVIGTLLDISDRKKAEETRLENLRLEAADKAKSEFIANMSHELRTPLNASIGFSQLLNMGMAGELSEKQKHYVDNILISNQFLLTLINDILDLSKIEAGKIDLVIDKMSVPETFQETLSLIKEKAIKHKVHLKTEFDPELEFIEADKQRFKQILFNLLGNAVKFSKEEGGAVTIRTKKDGGMAQISVSDTGIGIKDENTGKLFNKFEQLEKGISDKYGGTGLGLAITKQLVELHGGRIWVQSKYGEGTTFTFTLPLEQKK